MKEEKILLINTQFVELYVSGFTNRFIGLWCFLQKNPDQQRARMHWLTNRSLWNKYFPNKPKPDDVTVMKASLKYFRYTSRLFYPFYVLYVYYRQRCTSIHVATSIIDSLYLVRLFNLFRIPYCFTFASNSLDMAGYQSERVKKKWQQLFWKAKNIEVLNPTNSIDHYRGRKFISPTSFPYLPEIANIPEQQYTNPDREDLVVFCGSFVPQKNPLLAIDGFIDFYERFHAQHPNAKLAMVGKGGLADTVRERAGQLNEKYGRQLIEIVPDTQLLQLLSRAKIFLSLQDYDNYPSQAVMEAMLFCNATISIDNGDTRKLVKEEDGNILLQDKDPHALGEAIHQLLTGWTLYTQNRRRIHTDFSPRIFTAYFFDLHHTITAGEATV